MYDYGARHYDPSLGRWFVVDPLAEIYKSNSPYHITNNNPIYYREIDGRYFEGKDERRAKRIQRRAERRARKLERKADRLEEKGKDIGDLRERAGELCQSAQDVQDMRDDESTQYSYSSVSSKKAEEMRIEGPTTVSTGTNKKGHNVVTMFTEGNMETKLHETRHGGQNARGEINISTGKGYGVSDEVSAYRAQYSWSGNLPYLSHSIDQRIGGINFKIIQAGINPSFININSIHGINSNMVYDIGFRYTSRVRLTAGLTAIIPLYPPSNISSMQFKSN